MGYELHDERGVRIHVFHTDRELCDDEGCPCKLPSTTQKRAQERADRRAEFYVMVHGVKAILGPVSEDSARQGVRDALEAGQAARLLRVVEDYE